VLPLNISTMIVVLHSGTIVDLRAIRWLVINLQNLQCAPVEGEIDPTVQVVHTLWDLLCEAVLEVASHSGR